MEDIILSVKNLVGGYDKKIIIDDINIDFKEGKVYSIIGPNGCGKTTLIRTISRDLKKISGQVLLNGQDIFKMNTKTIAQNIATLSQKQASMSDVSVRSLVSYGRFAHKKFWQSNNADDEKIVDWALEKTNMTSYSNRPITELSGGELQRARIAMAIAQKPKILILDEPTTYLDISHQLEIMELISKLNKEENITIISVLHDINHAVRYSDQLIVIKDKKIYDQGDPWTLLEKNILSDVFNVEAEISYDQESKKPIFFAKRVVRK